MLPEKLSAVCSCKQKTLQNGVVINDANVQVPQLSAHSIVVVKANVQTKFDPDE